MLEPLPSPSPLTIIRVLLIFVAVFFVGVPASYFLGLTSGRTTLGLLAAGIAVLALVIVMGIRRRQLSFYADWVRPRAK